MPIIAGYWYFTHLTAEVNPEKSGKENYPLKVRIFSIKKRPHHC